MFKTLIEANQALEEEILRSKRAEDRFRSLLESAPDAVVIVNEQGKIVLINAQTEKLFGYSRAELLGHQIELLIPEISGTSYVTDPHLFGTRAKLERYARRKDRSEFPVEVMLSPIKTEEGILIANDIRDISEHVKIVESLAEERRLLHILMDNFPDLIYFKDTASRFTRINRAHARMLGVATPDDALGKTDADFQDPQLAKSFLAAESNIITSGQSVVNSEEFIPTPDGTPRWFSATKVPIKDADGRVTGIVGVSRDITQHKQTEEALRNSEEQFHSTFTYAAIGMALVSLDGRWLRVNNAVCEIVGYPEQELLTKTFQDITHPDDLDSDLKYISQLLAGEIQSFQMEKRYFHKLGHEVWVLLSVSLVRDGEGKPLHFISQIQNITERKRVEESLKVRMEEAHEFQSDLKALHEITIELMKIDDLDEFYKHAVKLGLQRLGFDRLALFLYDQENSTAIGTYGTDAQGKLVSEHHLRLDPSYLTSILFRALQKEERFVVDEEAQLFSNLQPIGIGWNAAAVLWNGTQIMGWLAIDNGVHHMPMTQASLDVLALYALTLGALLAQKRTQAALQESERHLRLIAQNSPDTIYIVDLAEQKAIYLNRTEFLGYSQFEVTKSGSLLGAIHPDDKARITAHWNDVIVDGNHSNIAVMEYRLQDKSGQWQWVQSRETIFATSAEGKATQILVTLTVITERKQAEQQALELTKEREQVKILADFIRDVSHDFRTPLATISSSLYLLIKTADPEKQKGYFDSAEEQIVRLTQLIDRLLIMGRLDSQSVLEFKQLDINQMLLDVSVKVGSAAKQKSITVNNRFQESSLMVQADPKQLSLAFAELAINAVMYTSANGTITICTWQEDNQAIIEVTDTGMGISSAELSLIFQRLYRVDKARSTTTGGAGLGLSIAKRIIELHQGTIEVESVPGEGSTFRVFLPLG